MTPEVDPLVEQALDAQARAGRYRRIELAILAATLAIILVAATLGLYFQARQNAIRDLGKREICIALSASDFESAVADALNAPPAPSPQREAAVIALHAAATQLHNVRKVCP
jgi:hypothetical protein